jgi:hypothetical protein
MIRVCLAKLVFIQLVCCIQKDANPIPFEIYGSRTLQYTMRKKLLSRFQWPIIFNWKKKLFMEYKNVTEKKFHFETLYSPHWFLGENITLYLKMATVQNNAMHWVGRDGPNPWPRRLISSCEDTLRTLFTRPCELPRWTEAQNCCCYRNSYTAWISYVLWKASMLKLFSICSINSIINKNFFWVAFSYFLSGFILFFKFENYRPWKSRQ